MRQLRQILRLHHEGVSAREVGRQLGVARSTVQDNLERAMKAGLAWPLAPDLTDDALERRLFSKAGYIPGVRRRVEPDWPTLAREVKRPGVNLQVLWDEYRDAHPEGYGYSRFCDLFREFERRLSPVTRQHHVAGDKLFVDYSGKKVGIVDPVTGVVREAEIFVGVLGATNYTYAEATFTQSLPDWIGAHVRMFRFLGGRTKGPRPAERVGVGPGGGVPRLLVPDNLKSGVNRPSFYDPEINRSYGAMAAHYDVGVLPARPRKPRDKAAVEAGVRFTQTYVLGRLRHETFFSLAECNEAIGQVLERLNTRVMRRLGLSRRDLFESVERPVLRPLPEADWQYAEWRLARVGLDYHVEVDGFYYSVPHALIRAQVDTRLTERTLEVFHRGTRVAAHQRRYGGRRHGTDPSTCPALTGATPSGPPTASAAGGDRSAPTPKRSSSPSWPTGPIPNRVFGTCLGILRLYRGIEAARAEAASATAVEIGAFTCSSVASILGNAITPNTARKRADPLSLFDHPNVRGAGYFN